MPGDVVQDFLEHREQVAAQIERRFDGRALALEMELERNARQHRAGSLLHPQHELFHVVAAGIKKPYDVAQRFNGLERDAPDFGHFTASSRRLHHFTQQGNAAQIAAVSVVRSPLVNAIASPACDAVFAGS